MTAILSTEQWSPWVWREPLKWRGGRDYLAPDRSDHIIVRTHDGTLVWRGWFRDRRAATEFYVLLCEGRVPADYWRSPWPMWVPGLEQVPGLEYEFASQVVLTSASSSPWGVPAGLSTVSKFELFGCGGNGMSRQATNVPGGAGGSGCYGFVNNVAVTPGGTVPFSIPPTGGQAVTWLGSSSTYVADYGRSAPADAIGNSGVGGLTANCIGLTATAGTQPLTSHLREGGMGGAGAPGPQGVGAASGDIANTLGGVPASGGGGANGGAASASTAASGVGAAGSAGGNGFGGTGGGAAGAAAGGAGGAATAGTGAGGGGGGGKTGANAVGGAGGVGANDTANTGYAGFGPGGGGGGGGGGGNSGGSAAPGSGGAGGIGAGGGGVASGNTIGASTGGAGGAGLIVGTYTIPVSPKFVPLKMYLRR